MRLKRRLTRQHLLNVTYDIHVPLSLRQSMALADLGPLKTLLGRGKLRIIES